MIGCAALTLVFTSCNNDDEANVPQNGNLELNLAGLEDLGADYQYEGWVVVEGTPVSTGTFTVNATGVLSQNQTPILIHYHQIRNW